MVAVEPRAERFIVQGQSERGASEADGVEHRDLAGSVGARDDGDRLEPHHHVGESPEACQLELGLHRAPCS